MTDQPADRFKVLHWPKVIEVIERRTGQSYSPRVPGSIGFDGWIDGICDLPLDEMLEFGMGLDGEPTDYGRSIDDLLGVVSLCKSSFDP